jgi:hypothetical protein
MAEAQESKLTVDRHSNYNADPTLSLSSFSIGESCSDLEGIGRNRTTIRTILEDHLRATNIENAQR